MPNKNKSPSYKEIEFIVSENQSGLRLDRLLAEHPNIYSRTKAAQLCSSGLVFLDNKPQKPSFKPEPGSQVRVQLPLQAPPLELEAYDFPLEILFEDSQVLVVNKPAGLVVHPSLGHKNKTLVNALLHHINDLSTGFQKNRPGIVHRLDKDTSGILVIAKNDYSHSFLAKQFKEKTIHRVYHAVVFSCPKKSSGTCRSYLRRHPNDRKQFASAPHQENETNPVGKLAITHYKTLSTTRNGFSLVECRLETGRTHQIRIHLSEMGHPIVGDRIYKGGNQAKNLRSVKLRKMIYHMDRIALHARELAFIHPSTGKLLSYSTPWPTPMIELLTEMGFENV